jgi:hypothetical protein
MADTQAVTYAELMQSPVIIGMVNRIATPLSLFQKFFGRLTGDNAASTQSVPGRDAGWDIFDSTRGFAGARAPDTGSRRVQKRVIGHQSAQLMHTQESIMVYDNMVFRSRGLGNQIGSAVDARGQQYIQNQTRYMLDRFRNQREWMYSRMLRGGFNMLRDGDNYSLRNYNASPSDGSIPINYQIPVANTGRLPLGSGGNILTDWGNASADIIGQLLEINKAFTRIHGRPLRHVWINSTTFKGMINNTGLQAIAGSAYRVFEALNPRNELNREGIRDAGFDVEFRALPQFVFHVYDGVLSADGKTEGITTSEMELLVPDDYAIFTPEPDGDWEGLIDGSELVLPNEMMDSYVVQGFGAWATRHLDPPAYEMKFVDNYLPVLYNPNCIGYGYVGS